MTDTTDWPDWFAEGFKHVWLPYTQMETTPPPVPVTATNGVHITLANGRQLIDGVSSWWTACHGYNHPHIREAVSEQLATMPHIMFGGLAHEPALSLAQRLSHLLPGDLNRVFFSESGSVSVEIAMKMALQYWINGGEKQRRKFIGFEYAYHGDTIGAMSVCDPEEGMHALFSGLLPEQHIVPLPRNDAEFVRFETFLREHAKGCAAIIIEPLIQGAGGMKMHTPDTLARIHQAAKHHDLLLIADEIMTGFGRTGTLFASEQADIAPDIVTLSKALTGGTMALAATVATDNIFDAFLSDDPEAALMHGPTYMASPLACAAAHASLDLFEQEPRLNQVSAIEQHLLRALEPCRDMTGVVDVRVKGAIGIVQLKNFSEHNQFKARFIEKGVWIRPFGDVVYLMPPFIIEEAELSFLTTALRDVVGDWSVRR